MNDAHRKKIKCTEFYSTSKVNDIVEITQLFSSRKKKLTVVLVDSDGVIDIDCS